MKNNKIPKLSPKLLSETEMFSLNTANIAKSVCEKIHSIDSSRKPTQDLIKDIEGAVNFCLRLWFKTISTASPITDFDISALKNIGARRFHQNIPLVSLLQSFRIGIHELWCSYIKIGLKDESLKDEILYSVSPYLILHFDETSQIMAQSYQQEQHLKIRWRTSLCYQLTSIIFNNPTDIDGFNSISESLGIDSRHPRVSYALRLKSIEVEHSSFEHEVDKLISIIGRVLNIPGTQIVSDFHRGTLIIWAPCVFGDSMRKIDRDAINKARKLLSSTNGIESIGIGLMGAGPKGWASSADEAIRALNTKNDVTENVISYSSIVIAESVRFTHNAKSYLVAIMEQLNNEPELLYTLDVYFSNKQKIKLLQQN
ncbi:TPA: hypothetical protein ACGE8T_003088 [Klebsiella pneumoniae]